MAKNSSTGLIVAIVFASSVISGSLVYLGTQVSGNGGGGGMDAEDLQAQIADGIDSYIAENAPGDRGAPKPTKVDGDFTDDDAFLGEDDAPVVIVEFSDYQCPFCVKFYTDTLPQIKENYIDTGKVKFVYRDLPLSFHADAYPAALFAECVRDQAGDEGYFAIHDEIFQTTDQAGIKFDLLREKAAELSVDSDELDDCIDTDKFKEEIDGDQADAARAGIGGTPGFIVNGNVISGAQPFAAFESVIEAELAK